MNFSPLKSILLRYDIAAFTACVLFFLAWPDFDLYLTHFFYDPTSKDFFWKNHFLATAIYELTRLIAFTLVISLIVLIASSWFFKKEYLAPRRKIFIFLLSACILGPGLMVNLTLKDNWGRARPRQVIEFGGDKVFSPPLSPRFECSKCKSFVSGHASVGFYFFSFALLMRNRKWLIAPIMIGAIIGSGRIVQGGHFFSDVLFSGWVVWFCSILTYSLFFRKKQRNPVMT